MFKIIIKYRSISDFGKNVNIDVKETSFRFRSHENYVTNHLHERHECHNCIYAL